MCADEGDVRETCHYRTAVLSRLVAAGLALAAAVLCVRLGFWQLDRHAGRVAQNAGIEARLALEPLDLAAGPGGDSGLASG